MLDPEAFEEAWAEGRTMGLEEVVAYALSGADAPKEPGP
jgi:hypothetical protein